jgi:hypothetical protein
MRFNKTQRYDDTFFYVPVKLTSLINMVSSPIRSLDRPLGLQEVEAPRISRQSVHEGGKVVSPKHRATLPQEIPLVLISVRGRVDPRATHINKYRNMKGKLLKSNSNTAVTDSCKTNVVPEYGYVTMSSSSLPHPSLGLKLKVCYSEHVISLA